MDCTLSYHVWCLPGRFFLLASLLRTSAPASATFPLPFLDRGLFDGSGPKLARRDWQRLVKRRLLHCIIAALNFLHGGSLWPSSKLLWRTPNAHHRRCYQRICRFVVACSSREERFPLPPGRSGPELLARLAELEDFARGLPDPCSYSPFSGMDFEPSLPSGSAAQVPAVPPSEELPQLRPYRFLDVSRLKLSGTGAWPIINHLDGPLWLPFVEPQIMQHHQPLEGFDLPTFEAEDLQEKFRRGLLRDSRGLLRLLPSLSDNQAYRHTCRIFNAFKAADRDRQIGNRRIANASERHVPGPSKRLPQGQSLVGLQVAREQITAYVSDRKDFYHQVEITPERSMSNRLPFSYALDSFRGTKAYDDFQALQAAMPWHWPPQDHWA